MKIKYKVQHVIRCNVMNLPPEIFYIYNLSVTLLKTLKSTNIYTCMYARGLCTLLRLKETRGQGEMTR